MISLKFPDGNAREYENGVTGRDVAASIAKSLEKKAVAVVLNGELADLADEIEQDFALWAQQLRSVDLKAPDAAIAIHNVARQLEALNRDLGKGKASFE